MSVINPIWFYIADMVSKLSILLVAATTLLAILLVILIVITLAVYGDYDWDERGEVFLKAIKITAIGTIISGSLCVIIPNDRTIYKMLIAKNVTYENLDKASEVIKDSVDYIFDKVNGKEEGESND